ncbi:Cystatin-F [Labeo rohita]|uniref:Cystatin-F n=1 Tax=Labeo rohita TaxID=84645 RepID=A0ABQ8M5T5_LABRO|nr:Cystatin-F [Labeo rohita]
MTNGKCACSLEDCSTLLVVEVLLNRKLLSRIERTSTDMRVFYQTLVLLFSAGLCSLEKVPGHTFVNKPIPGTLQNVSKNDTGVKQAVLTGTYSFNNKSNDAFLFKPSAVDDAKRQIVKGIRYILEVEISRTVCRKRDNTDDLNNCVGVLPQKVFDEAAHQQLKVSSHHDASSCMIHCGRNAFIIVFLTRSSKTPLWHINKQLTFLCHFEVWSIPWMKTMSTTFFKCRSNDTF